MHNIAIPGIWKYRKLNLAFLKFYYSHQDLVDTDFKPSIVYGAIPNMIWNGDTNLVDTVDMEEINKLLDRYNNLGVTVRVSCNNRMIENQNDLLDTLCNLVMRSLQDRQNTEVELIYDSLLYKYIRSRYPGIGWCCTDSSYDYMDIDNNYNRYIVDTPQLALRFDKSQQRHDIEISLNNFCRGCSDYDRCINERSYRQTMYYRDPPVCNGSHSGIKPTLPDKTSISEFLRYRISDTYDHRDSFIRTELETLDRYLYLFLKHSQDYARIEILSELLEDNRHDKFYIARHV